MEVTMEERRETDTIAEIFPLVDSQDREEVTKGGVASNWGGSSLEPRSSHKIPESPKTVIWTE